MGKILRENPKVILPWLDMVRGLAALAVMLGHLRGQYFVKWDDLHPDGKTAVNYLLFASTRLGREAVIVFFVLSGFLVGGSAVKQFLEGRFRVADYAIARISRLYVVLFPALLFTGLCDWLRLQIDPTLGAQWSLGIAAFLGNLGFLQDVCVPTYGSNAPLWSLGYEFWYYFLCGAALLILVRPGLFRTLIGIIGVILGLVIMPHGCLVLLPIWCAGAVLKFIPIRLNLVAGFVALVIFSLTVGLSLRTESTLTDYIEAVAFLPLLAGLARLPESGWSVVNKTGKWLASFSYTLYANHCPLVGLLLVALVPVRVPDAGLKQWLGLAGLAGLIIVINYGLYWCFERRTDLIRKFITVRLHSHSTCARQ